MVYAGLCTQSIIIRRRVEETNGGEDTPADYLRRESRDYGGAGPWPARSGGLGRRERRDAELNGADAWPWQRRMGAGVHGVRQRSGLVGQGGGRVRRDRPCVVGGAPARRRAARDRGLGRPARQAAGRRRRRHCLCARAAPHPAGARARLRQWRLHARARRRYGVPVRLDGERRDLRRHPQPAVERRPRRGRG